MNRRLFLAVAVSLIGASTAWALCVAPRETVDFKVVGLKFDGVAVGLDGGGYVGVATADGGTTTFFAPAASYQLRAYDYGSVTGNHYDPDQAGPLNVNLSRDP